MDHVDRLATLFEKFPGIGPRQAGRFVHFLLRSPTVYRKELSSAIASVGSSVSRCTRCMRFHAGGTGECALCADTSRDRDLLAIVATDADLTALERSGSFHGLYFVLGGTISLASDKDGERFVAALSQRINDAPPQEVILALPASPEGDVTASYVRGVLEPLMKEYAFVISALGRGLSTGSELEYADSDTLKSAFDNRRNVL